MLYILDKMVEKLSFLRGILHQATAYGSRSTVLYPLGWIAGIGITATISAFYFKLPPWIGIVFAAFCFLVFLLYAGTFLYLLFHDRDSLRSEKFVLSKKIIESEIAGDSLRGFLKKEEIAALLTEKASPESEPKS